MRSETTGVHNSMGGIRVMRADPSNPTHNSMGGVRVMKRGFSSFGNYGRNLRAVNFYPEPTAPVTTPLDVVDEGPIIVPLFKETPLSKYDDLSGTMNIRLIK